MTSTDTVYINIQDEELLPEQQEERTDRNQTHGSDFLASTDTMSINSQDEELLPEQQEERAHRNQTHGSVFSSFGFIVERGELKQDEVEQWGEWNTSRSNWNPFLLNLSGTREGRGRGNYEGEPCILRFQKRWDAQDILWLIIKRSLLMSFQLIDILTDVYFAVALYHNEAYKDVPTMLRDTYVGFLIVSMAVSAIVPLVAAYRVSDDLLPSGRTAWTFQGRLAVFFALAFDMPIHLLFHKDFTTFEEGWLVVSAYRDIHDYKKWSHVGVIWSHSFSLLLEDIPLFIISVMITSVLDEFTFVVVMALTFSFFAVCFKMNNVVKTLLHKFALPSVNTLIALLKDEQVSIHQKENAAWELRKLATESLQQQVAICEAGGIVALLDLLKDGSELGKENAADALSYLAHNNARNQVAICEAQGIKPLVQLLQDGTAVGKQKAAVALSNLANNADNKVRIAREGGIEALIALLRDGSAEGKTEAAGALWYLSRNADNKVRIAREGGIEPLIALLRDGSAEGKTNAAGALGNVALNADNQVRIAREGGIEPLIALLRDGSAEGKTVAAGALWNLAANNADNKVRIAREGGIEALIALLRDGSAEGKTKAATALWILALNADTQVRIAREGGIEALIGLLRDGSAEGKRNAAWALWNLAANADNKVRIAREGGIEALIGLLRDGSAEGKTQAAGALGNLAANADNKVRIQTAYNEETDTTAKTKIKDLLDRIGR